jgi:chaperone BCS1
VLPSSTKDKIIEDLNKFLTVPTYTFYVEHGIPYKRSYLFYGEPGAGKTSLIQALAGKYKRNLCIMQPTTSKNFNDDSLANAIKSAPRRSIIVLEDVDALFDKNRKCQTKLSITFSGLLNALDGIANPDGQIFIMTTNFRGKTAGLSGARIQTHRHIRADTYALTHIHTFIHSYIHTHTHSHTHMHTHTYVGDGRTPSTCIHSR